MKLTDLFYPVRVGKGQLHHLNVEGERQCRGGPGALLDQTRTGCLHRLPLRPTSQPARAPTPRPTANVIATERNGSRFIL